MLDIMKAVDSQLQVVIDGTMEDNKKETDSETRRYGEGFCAGIELAQRYIRNADIKLYECYVDSEGYERCSHCNEHETGMMYFSFCPRCGVRLKHKAEKQMCETCRYYNSNTYWCSQYNDTTYNPNCSLYQVKEG